MKYAFTILIMCGVAFASQEPMSIEEVAAAGPQVEVKEEEETKEEKKERADEIKAKIETKKEARTADASIPFPTGSAAAGPGSNTSQTVQNRGAASEAPQGIRVNATVSQGSQNNNNNGITFGNIYELFGTIDDRTVGETPAVIGISIVKGR